MSKISLNGTLLFFLFLPVFGYGQAIDTAHLLNDVAAELKSVGSTSCKYVATAKFPTGETDQIKGVAYINKDAQLLYNDCDAFTMVLTAHWYYKADHRNKELTIINLDRNYKKELKAQLVKQIFQQGEMINFVDSVLLKKARIKKLKKENDIETIEVTFPTNMNVEEIDITYNAVTRKLIVYDAHLFDPAQRTAKGVEGSKERIKCTEFMKINDLKKYNESNYFSYNAGKLTVKKYNNYKLSSKL